MKRVRPAPEFAVPLAVQRILEAFEYPDDLGGGGPVSPTGGGGAPTIVVAASNSTELSKTRADIICPGTNDHVFMQQAADALVGTGGRLILCEGQFNVTTNSLDIGENVHLYGLGPFVTVIRTTSTSGAILATGHNCVVAGINFTIGTTFTCTGVEVNGDTTTVTHNHFNQLAKAIDLTQGGGGNEALITLNRTTESLIFVDGGAAESVVVANNLRGQAINVSGGVGWTITDNQKWRGQINLTSATGFVVAGNVWDTGATPSGASDAIINLDTCESGVVADNTVHDGGGYDGIILDTCTSVKVQGNFLNQIIQGIILDASTECSIDNNTLGGGDGVFSALYGHGIQVIDSSHNNLTDNLIVRPGKNTNNTFDGIILSGNSDQNNIQDNKIAAPSSGNEPRYGINISAATCDNNVMNDNMAGPAAGFGTGAFNDAGTGTQGANFTT